jgi:hypothetical protein
MDESDRLSDNDIKELIEEIKKMKVVDTATDNKHVDIDNALACTIKEFLTSFLLIGYDMEGSPVIIRSDGSEMGKDALRSLLLKYMQLMLYEE